MLRISKLTDYATVIMAELASAYDLGNERSNDGNGACRSSSSVAEATRLEAPTVAKVLKTLARAGLIESIRGVNGGYRLGRPAEAISVASIIRAMEGPIALTECGLEPGLCTREHDCHLKGNWQRIGETVEQALESLTLADLCAPKPPRIRLVESALERV